MFLLPLLIGNRVVCSPLAASAQSRPRLGGGTTVLRCLGVEGEKVGGIMFRVVHPSRSLWSGGEEAETTPFSPFSKGDLGVKTRQRHCVQQRSSLYRNFRRPGSGDELGASMPHTSERTGIAARRPLPPSACRSQACTRRPLPHSRGSAGSTRRPHSYAPSRACVKN